MGFNGARPGLQIPTPIKVTNTRQFMRRISVCVKSEKSQLYSPFLLSVLAHLAGPFEVVVQMALASTRDPDGTVRNFPRSQDPGIYSDAK